MNRARRARIVATLGPASRAPSTVKALAQAGVDVFRLNFSHGSHDDHAAALKAVRGAEMALQRPLGVLADLQGPKLRLGRFKDVEISVKPGHTMRFDLDPTPGDATRVRCRTRKSSRPCAPACCCCWTMAGCVCASVNAPTTGPM